MTQLIIHRPGIFLTVQDLGRRGLAHLGVARSGAADRGSLRLANYLVGNDDGTEGLESVLGGMVLEATGALVVAVTGAACDVTLNSRLFRRDTRLRLQAGDVLEVGRVTRGLRVYIAVRDGLDVPRVLGSRSYDQLGQFGPAPLYKGDRITVGSSPPANHWVKPPLPTEIPAKVELRVIPGPRDEWLDAPGLSQLTDVTWTVAPSSNRTGLRLSGPPISRRKGELASEGVVPGSLQLPASGQPILLGPDAGVTGGYPAIAVVVDADLDLAGQLPPGATVSFREIAS
ncbi:MAG: biotin-dependent carboxyltransferase family protein [Candidatus Dormibacteria bacterium]